MYACIVMSNSPFPYIGLQDNSEDIRSLVLLYIIFHRLNRNSSMVSHLDIFKFSQ
jgi:hypothetical protein